MKIYRYETADGLGPYVYDSVLIPGDWENRPGPVRDCKLEDRRGNGGLWGVESDALPFNDATTFGFISLEQCANWFWEPDVRQDLHDVGYRLYEYEADAEHVHICHKQVAFNKYFAHRTGVSYPLPPKPVRKRKPPHADLPPIEKGSYL